MDINLLAITSGLKAYGVLVFCKLCTIFNFLQRGIVKQGEKPVQLQTQGPLTVIIN